MVVPRMVIVCPRKESIETYTSKRSKNSMVFHSCLEKKLKGSSGIRLVELRCLYHNLITTASSMQRRSTVSVQDSFHQDEFPHRMGASHIKIHYFLRSS